LALGVALTVALTMGGCSRKPVYNCFASTSVEGWERNDTLTLGLGPVDLTGRYDETLALRATTLYPFTSLTIIVEQQVRVAGQSSLTPLRTDTICCRLTDAEGTPLGPGTNYHQYTFPLTSLRLAQGDSIAVRIHHFMKRELLPGIIDIGLIAAR